MKASNEWSVMSKTAKMGGKAKRMLFQVESSLDALILGLLKEHNLFSIPHMPRDLVEPIRKMRTAKKLSVECKAKNGKKAF